MTTPRRVLILAIDAATPDLLRRWCADGTLPNIAQLMDAGLVADTRGVEGLEVGATWPSFCTGRNPAGHGVCWIDRVIPGTYRAQLFDPAYFDAMIPFWQHLLEAGKRVLIMDIPFGPRVDHPGAVQVLEWGVHDGVRGFETTPASLKKEILREFGIHPPRPDCDTRRIDAAGYRAYRDKLLRGCELRAAITRKMLREHPWDFAIQVFNEMHCGGHVLWHYHDPSHPNHDAEAAARDGDLLREVYMGTDRAIGAIVAEVPDDVTVMILALHGMGHTCGSSLLLPHILERMGALRPGSPKRSVGVAPAWAPPSRGPAAGRRRGHPAKRLYRALVPEPVRLGIYELRQYINRRWLGRGSPIDIVPSATKAFQMGFGMGSTYSGIRLNIVGREPEGTLHRGDEVEAFIEELRGVLAEMVDPETGRPLVRRLVRTGDLHQGERLEDLPDLLVEWEYDTGRGSTAVGDGRNGVWRGWSERIGTVEHPNGGGRTGAHRLEGILIAAGAGIAPGPIARMVSPMDLAPTVGAMLGVAIPPGDGSVVEELVR